MLHKDLSVYEHLYDEGKARIDPSDQSVVVKAVYSQDRPLREGSVVPDFDDPQYEHRPVPPVPSWSETPSNPGKRRPSDEDEDRHAGPSDFPRAKRQRVGDVAGDDSDDDIIQSVERDVPMEGADVPLPDSPTLIQETQESPEDALSDRGRMLVRLNANGIESPYNGSFARRNYMSSNGVPFAQSQNSLHHDGDRTDAQALLTPPSDATKTTWKSNARPAHSSKRKVSPVQASSSGERRHSSFKKEIYDMDNEEPIDDSQMSPKSKLVETQKSQKKKSASKSSRNHMQEEPLRPYKGDVTMKEVRSIIDDGGENNFTAVNHHGDPLQVHHAAVAATKLLGDDAALLQDKEQDEQLPGQISKDVHMQDDCSLSLPIDPISNCQQSTRERRASLHPKTTPKQRDTTRVKHANVKPADSAPQPEQKKKGKKRKSQIDNPETRALMSIDTNRTEPDTKQSTPIDSPGEQLLEMQASSQKPRQESLTQESKKAAKKAKIQREKQRKFPDDLSGIVSNRKQRREVAQISKNTLTSQATPIDIAEAIEKAEKKQKSKQSKKAQATQVTTTPCAGNTTKQVASEGAPKSPYARESPPRGSIGLGFTNSPHRPSTASTDDASLNKRKLFETKQVQNSVATSDALKDNDSSSDSDEEESDSNVGTPSKTALPKETQTAYQKFIATKKPSLETSNSIRPDPPSTAGIALPPGWTLERFEAQKKAHEKKIATGEEKPKERKPTKKQLLKNAQELTSLARVVSKDSTTSLATSEKSKLMGKRGPKKEREEQEAATVQALTKERESKSKLPAEVEEKKLKKTAKTAAKAANTPSSTASESSKAFQAVSAKATVAPPTKTATSSAAKSRIIQPRKVLADLIGEFAAKSIPSSLAAPVVAPSTKSAAKSFNTLDEESSEDEASDDEDEDDINRQKTMIIAASKPDASTRDSQVDSEVDMDSDESEG